MIRLAIVAEGRTEEEFIRKVLAAHLRERGVDPTPILLGVGRRGLRGGNVSTQRLAEDMARLFPKFDAVSSLVDFYGFRGKDEKSSEDLEQEIGKALKNRLASSWRKDRVLPYVRGTSLKASCSRMSMHSRAPSTPLRMPWMDFAKSVANFARRRISTTTRAQRRARGSSSKFPATGRRGMVPLWRGPPAWIACLPNALDSAIGCAPWNRSETEIQLASRPWQASGDGDSCSKLVLPSCSRISLASLPISIQVRNVAPTFAM